MTDSILVTGANGFIGRRLVQVLTERGMSVRRCTRNQGAESDVAVGDIDGNTEWGAAVDGVSHVVHLMALAHVTRAPERETRQEFRRVNVDACLNLARQCAAAGVKRFVFLSSIGVNGERAQQSFSEQDTPAPTRPYAISKFEAEQGLRDIAAASDMEVVIIRPPLVYGRNAPGNFSRLVKLVKFGLPLPLAALRNRRSFVALDNLVDFINCCLHHPRAADETFLVADGVDLSIVDLLRSIGDQVNKPARLIPVPLWMLKLLAGLVGRRNELEQLSARLTIDISKAQHLLDWKPPLSPDEGLRRALGQRD